MRSRQLLIGGAVVIVLAAIAVWIQRNTYWTEIGIPTLLTGEAAEDPYYAAKRLVQQMGATAESATMFPAPPAGDVIFLSNWSWTLSAARRQEMEDWVASGGRLVLDNSVFFGREFMTWAGIEVWDLTTPREEAEGRRAASPCLVLEREGPPAFADEPWQRTYSVCNMAPAEAFGRQRRSSWELADDKGVRAVRMPVGSGNVTLIRGVPFSWRALLQEDHAELFVAMTQLQRGDHVHFLAESDHPSLPALTWRHGWPALVLAFTALALALWRVAIRFGPPLPVAVPVRRSLVEQIRGTARFLVRRGGGRALHAATARALEAAARGHIPGYDSMSHEPRMQALAKATGFSAAQIESGLRPATNAGPRTFIAAIVHLESARRRIVSHKKRRTHGS
jgi:hypothetical protein